MSERKDIIDGTKVENLSKKFGLIYTYNCGWIDLGHLNPNSDRLEIGAANLWKQITNEGEALIDPKCASPDLWKHTIHNVAVYLSRPDVCDTDPRLKFPDGSTGFKVVYRQDHAKHPGKPGRQGVYVVKHGLNINQKKQVALAIFMEVSLRFENLQSLFSLITDSGFSQEDLVSNLIGFYIGIGEIDKVSALQACKPVSEQVALKIWDEEGSVGSNKNRSWTPKYSTSVNNYLTRKDNGIIGPPVIPDLFHSITPAVKGVLFKELLR